MYNFTVFYILARKLDLHHISEILVPQKSLLYVKVARFHCIPLGLRVAGKLQKSVLRICEEIKDSKGLKTDEKAPFTDSNLVFCFDVLRFEESSEPNSNHCGII